MDPKCHETRTNLNYLRAAYDEQIKYKSQIRNIYDAHSNKSSRQNKK